MLRQLWVFVTSYPDVLAAMAGFGLLVAGITSVRYVRRQLRYETWWVVHLYTYLALALAFAHQIVTGASFIGHPLTRAVWIAIWAGTAGLVIVFRIVQPIWRSVRHQLRVVEVCDEAPGVVSVIWAAQQALNVFRGRGIRGAIVNAAGDIASTGGLGPGEPFRIGIPDPFSPRRTGHRAGCGRLTRPGHDRGRPGL